MRKVESTIFILPFPDSALYPNRKMHWAKRMEAARTSRSASTVLCLAHKPQGWRPLNRAELTITWYPASQRVADYDSLLAATKPLIDGIVEAGILKDDNHAVIKGITLRLGEVDKNNPRTEVETREIQGGAN